VNEFFNNLLNKIFGSDDDKTILNDRLEIRINDEEKVLFKKYAKVRGVDTSSLIRSLVRIDIDKFINNHN